MLRRDLTNLGVPFTEINIWEDPDAAAFVRSAADGNEVVPTVTVGGAALVNPSAAEVLALTLA
jgi:mycoredoxin